MSRGRVAAAVWNGALAALLAVAWTAGWPLPADARQAAPPRSAVQATATPPPGRAPLDLTPLHYQLSVTPDFGTASFDGHLTIDLRIQKSTTRITLDAVDLEIYGAEIFLPYDRQVKPAVTADPAAGTVTFTTPTRLYPGTVKLQIEYGGKLRPDGRGFYLARSNGRKYLLSQMEATDARRAFPCVDDPAYKASFALSAVIDDTLTAISNGPLVSDTAAEKFGKHVLRFGTTPRMSTYLVALAVGEFGCVGTSAESVPIRVCTTPEKKGRGAFVLEAARRAFQFHARYFTFKYPFRKLDLVAIPGGFPGAMENSGAIFFDEDMLADPAATPATMLAAVAVTVSHEIAHQWLGDVVTMRWWDDLWLNEGLATWIEAKPIAEWKPSWRVDLAQAASARRAMRADAFRSARAVRAPVATEAEIEESFDEMAYDKAGAVLRMVEAWIGPDVFRSGLNSFIRAHAYESATAEDLWTALAAAADEPVDLVMRAFLSRPGIPLVTIGTACDGNETVVTASVKRFTLTPAASAVTAAAELPGTTALSRPASHEAVPTLPPAAAWPIPLQVRGVNPSAPMLTFSPRLVTEEPQTFRIGGCFPAVLANSAGTGYFRTEYSAATLVQLTSVSKSRLTPAERLRLLDNQWALAGAGTSGIGDYLALVGELAADPTPEVVETIADGLVFLRERVVDDSSRDAFEGWVRKTMAPVAAALGWRPTPDESEERQRLRAAVVRILGEAGRDPEVLATARGLFAADASGAQRLDAALRETVTRLAARSGGAGFLRAMRAQGSLETIAAAGDEMSVTAVIEDALKNEANWPAVPGLLAAGLGNPAANVQVWSLVTSRWSDIQPAIASHVALSQVVTAAGSFCQADARDAVQGFLAAKAPAVARTLQQSVERIDACRDFRLNQGAALAAWLGRQ